MEAIMQELSDTVPFARAYQDVHEEDTDGLYFKVERDIRQSRFINNSLGSFCLWKSTDVFQVFSESSKWAAESIGAFRCVSSLTLEDVIIERYKKLLDGHVVSAYRKARWTTLIFALSDSLALACQALIFWYGGRLLASGEYQVLNFFVCFMAVTQGAEQAGVGFSFGPNAAQANAAANRILSIRESRGERASLNDETAGGNKETETIPDSENGIKIELKDVGFRYPTRQAQVFKHLNITVEKGQFAALVGASGAGKSSTVALLERFYDAQQGSIMCNGRDIKSVDVNEYRKLFSLVAQEASLFQGKLPLNPIYLASFHMQGMEVSTKFCEGTIRENILLGIPDSSTVTDDQLHQACKDAAIHDFIISLPEGCMYQLPYFR